MQVPVASTVAFLAARERDRLQAMASTAAGLRARASEAAAVLRREFGVTDVWLFGSVAESRVHEASDVDIAVRGLKWERFADAHDAMVVLFGTSVDLVALETAAPSLIAKVERRGIRL